MQRKTTRKQDKPQNNATSTTDQKLNQIIAMLSDIMTVVKAMQPAERPSRCRRGKSRRGFTRRQIAKWFAVCEMEIYRWDKLIVLPPAGYSEALRLSGNFESLTNVLKNYWDIRRIKGGDVYSTGRIDHIEDPSVLLFKT